MKIVKHLWLLFVSCIALTAAYVRGRYRSARARWFPRRRPQHEFMARPAKTAREVARLYGRAVKEQRDARIVVDSGGYAYEVFDPAVTGIVIDDSAFMSRAWKHVAGNVARYQRNVGEVTPWSDGHQSALKGATDRMLTHG